jgi:hypothetical protein
VAKPESFRSGNGESESTSTTSGPGVKNCFLRLLLAWLVEDVLRGDAEERAVRVVEAVFAALTCDIGLLIFSKNSVF